MSVRRIPRVSPVPHPGHWRGSALVKDRDLVEAVAGARDPENLLAPVGESLKIFTWPDRTTYIAWAGSPREQDLALSTARFEELARMRSSTAPQGSENRNASQVFHQHGRSLERLADWLLIEFSFGP
jgi:hypothetical protein